MTRRPSPPTSPSSVPSASGTTRRATLLQFGRLCAALLPLLAFGGCAAQQAPTVRASTAASAPRPATTAPSQYPQSLQAAAVPAYNVRPRKAPPTVTAKAAIVIHANTGTVLYEKNADLRLPVASTQKLMTGLLLVEAGNMSKKITVHKSDTWVEPTKMGLQAGQVYKKQDLLRAVLVRSSNDIAHCLARDHAGSEAAFANLMTQRARQLGMNNSQFRNASGLPASGQYSTARDLSILASTAMRHSFIKETVQTKSLRFHFPNGNSKLVTNTNKVLLRDPYCNGMKTGYTHAAGRCLVSAGTYKGRNVIVVVLGSKTPNIWDESQALLRWGLEVDRAMAEADGGGEEAPGMEWTSDDADDAVPVAAANGEMAAARG